MAFGWWEQIGWKLELPEAKNLQKTCDFDNMKQQKKRKKKPQFVML